MQLAFIMPSELQRKEIGRLRETVVEMRPDQLQHFEHLIRSWRVFGIAGDEAIAAVARAVKRTFRDRP